jgi:type IV pilus assembly protein PilM
MIFGEKTVAGIDISQERISIALLKLGKNGPKLVKSVVAAVPAGAIKDGNIADAVLLARAIRAMKVHNRIWTNRAAVSLFAKPVITQMIEMPKQIPSNMTQFVHGEMKHCAAMPGEDIVLDYCSVGSNRRSADKKILVAAAETKKVTKLLRVLGRAGFSAEVVEPAMVSYLRAIGGKKNTSRSGCNVLVAMLRGEVLSLCVLKNGSVDFVRTKEFTNSTQEESPDACPAFGKAWDANLEECRDCAEVYPDEYAECKKLTLEGNIDSNDLDGWLAVELSEVVRFYDIEVHDNPSKWEITVFVDAEQSPEVIEKYIKSKIQAEHLQVRTIEDAYMDTPVDGLETSNSEKPSPVAVGLAVNLLVAQRDDVRLNLMPPQIAQIKDAKRDVLVVATVVAALVLLMVLAVAAPAYMTKKVSGNIAAKAAQASVHNADKMIEKNQYLDTRLEALSGRLDSIAKISASHNDVNWIQLFANIRNAAPASVRIVSFSCPDGQKVQINGLALSDDAVNLFVSMLEKSADISTVTLLESSKQEGQKGYINYKISCKLGVKKGKDNNVS